MTQILEEAQTRLARSAKKTGFLITFSGIDGSGKSSQAVSLLRTLSNRQIPAVRAWAGNKPMLSYPFLALVRFLGLTRRKRIQGLVFVQRDIKRNRAISRLWPFVMALDFVPKALVSVMMPLRRGKVVVCDRYVYDFIAELSDEGLIGNRGIALLLGLLPKPDLAFLMDVDVELAWKRALVPGRAREQPIYNLSARRRTYLKLSRQFGIIAVDGSNEPPLNQSIILDKTLAKMEMSRLNSS
jgi:thymidylate kinase